MIFAKPEPILLMTNFTKDSYTATYFCDLTFSKGKFRLWSMIMMGFLMIFYVVIRFAYLTKNRRRNANSNSSTSSTTPNVVAARRPLSLPMVYWALSLSVLTFMLVWISSSLDEKPDKLMTMNRDTGIFGLIYKNFLYILISYVITYLDSEKRKDIIFYNCGGQNGNENLRNSANKLDGEAWVICSKKDRKKDVDEEKVVENNDTSTQAQV
jgi:hypothetical protein